MASEQDIIRIGKELDKVVQLDPVVSASRFLFFHFSATVRALCNDDIVYVMFCIGAVAVYLQLFY